MSSLDLVGRYDMHVHSSPDIRERRYTDFEMLDAGVSEGAKAIVLKSHHGTTMNRAFLCNEYNRIVNKKNDFVMYGSVTLNKGIGGLNPVAVAAGIKMGAKVIWLPTMHAKNQMEINNKSGGIDCFDEKGNIKPELLEIFKLIKENNLVLGTGHLNPEEIFKVVDVAKNMGLKKVVVTHPEFWVVGMSHDDQKRIVETYDVILERCYAQPLGGGAYKSNLADNLAIIKLVGYKNIMIDTDGGQVENPPWEIAFKESINFLHDNGISKDQINHMTQTIPKWLLEH